MTQLLLSAFCIFFMFIARSALKASEPAILRQLKMIEST
jgi:hypothetical protein